jgi:hypothetical protein
MLIVFLQQEIDVFKDQSLHFPHDMRGNAAIPTKAHWIEPEFAFTFRTPNVDVGRLCALVRVKVKPKSAYSEYRWHPFKVFPLGHAGKFCSGQGGDVTAIPVRQRPCATSCQPLPPVTCRACVVCAATNARRSERARSSFCSSSIDEFLDDDPFIAGDLPQQDR